MARPEPAAPQPAPALTRRARIASVIAAAIIAVASVVFLAAWWYAGESGHPEVRPDRWHHLYVGVLCGAVGAWRRSPALLLIGAVIAADDAWQHLRHVTGSPEYLSPLRVFFARFLWPFPAVQRVTRWLDWLLS